MSWLGRLSCHMQELRIIVCPTGEGSAGVREFLQNNYQWIKTLNPRLPISVRSGETANADIYCRYDYNKTAHIDADFLSAKEIEQNIRKFSVMGSLQQKAPGESEWKEPQVVFAKHRGRVCL